MTYINPLAVDYLRLAQHGIAPDNFVGADMRYSAEYELLENELGKAAALQAGNIDWALVRSQAEALLATQSKDLRVAVWLVWSLYQCESLRGLHAGLQMLHELCAAQWDALLPSKPRTRLAALTWLAQRLEQLGGALPASVAEPLARALIEVLTAFDSLLTARFDAPALSLHALIQSLQELLTSTPTAAPVRPAQPLAVAPNGMPDNDAEAQRQLRHLQELARPLASYWLTQRPGDPRAVRLARGLQWLAIDSLPTCDDARITTLRGLPAGKVASYRERLQQKPSGELLAELEASVARAPFWLDGQRLVWQCLQLLGAPIAMREVEGQLALFLQRLDGVETLHFHDGTPFADAETLVWIATQVRPQPLAPLDSNRSAADAPAWTQALDTGRATLRQHNLKAAVRLLKDGMRTARGGREQFFWQLTLARLCVEASRYELAKPLLESLDRQLLSTGVADWEPDLALEVLQLLHSCCQRLTRKNDPGDQQHEIHRRLCRLDLEAVLD
ncbi:type VI secretion system protein TssA [Pseudomonas sp. UL073]|uniref:Type VI secretion system protein TssA n=1 Tax=Zestomonas insulae TaxID=2809017 RepID=A0ABS2IJX2_9GAMM|nr:type VI secretion system protein TssA [Pseudomonas insulae]MBM7063361.1 type VI secretion system protein TssA [Pseudomonas insulae]